MPANPSSLAGSRLARKMLVRPAQSRTACKLGLGLRPCQDEYDQHIRPLTHDHLEQIQGHGIGALVDAACTC